MFGSKGGDTPPEVLGLRSSTKSRNDWVLCRRRILCKGNEKVNTCRSAFVSFFLFFFFFRLVGAPPHKHIFLLRSRADRVDKSTSIAAGNLRVRPIFLSHIMTSNVNCVTQGTHAMYVHQTPPLVMPQQTQYGTVVGKKKMDLNTPKRCW